MFRSAHVCVAVALVVLGGAAVAGPLTPPGPPADTTDTLGYKTMRQLEPRRLVRDLPGDFESLHVVAEDGSYYLDADLVNADGLRYGVKILARDVTLDLGGFGVVDISGVGETGVQAAGPAGSTVVISNGAVFGWSVAGVSVNAARALVTDIHATGNGSYGFLQAFPGAVQASVFRRCIATGHDAGGSFDAGFFVVNATLEQCASLRNTRGFSGVNSSFVSCVATDNIGVGFEGSGNSLVSCVAERNNDLGAGPGGFFGVDLAMEACVAVANDGYGAELSASVATACLVSGSSLDGMILEDSRVNDCLISRSGSAGLMTPGSGLLVGSDNHITQSISALNRNDGFVVVGVRNSIDSNVARAHSSPDDAGFRFLSGATQNALTRNFAIQNDINYDFTMSSPIRSDVQPMLHDVVPYTNLDLQ